MMTAIDFLKTVGRMCRTYDNCDGCPLSENCSWNSIFNRNECQRTKVIQTVEKWAEDHPVKTRQSELLKMYPKARKEGDSILTFCPRNFDPTVKCNIPACYECRQKYWLEEV